MQWKRQPSDGEEGVSEEKVPEEELRPETHVPSMAPEVVVENLAVPIVVLTTRDYYILAAMQGVLATKANLSPEELRTRCEKIADEFLG